MQMIENPRTSAHSTMTEPKHHGRKILVAIGMATILIVSRHSAGAGLSLANSPLFVSAGAPPNIFFLTDDSGSMDWHMVTTEDDGVFDLTAGGNTTSYHYLFPDADNNYSSTSGSGRTLPDEDEIQATANMPADAHGVWRGHYSGYNRLYYNPEVNYQPWPGVDSAGNPMPNAKATDASAIAYTAVRLDPFNASSATVDLTATVAYTADNVPRTNGTLIDLAVTTYSAKYFTWTDSDSDGVVDAADGHQRYDIRPTGSGCPGFATCPSTFTRSSARNDCVATSGANRICTATEEMKNFANWYMYDRRRDLTAKNAISNVIAPKGSEVRMGHATLHNNSGTSNIQIAAMATSLTSGTKKSLLDAVFGMVSNNSTPVRTKLYEVGRYYECQSGSIFGGTSSYTCPWLAAASGGNCQQSFTIAMTDGYYNDTFTSLPGNDNVDADGASPNASGNTGFDGGAYADTYADTLADIAMHFYERDLRSGLNNDVPQIVGIDTATHQHMVTFGVAFGVNGTLSAGPTDPSNPFAWPNPTAGDQQKIDDLRHAAYNGRGEFLNASDPVALADSLKNSIDAITERTGSASAVAVNSRTLQTNSAVYQARFTSLEWSGELRAIALDSTTGAIGAEIWNAKDILKNNNTTGSGASASRVFLTYRQKDALGGCVAGTGTNGGVIFSWTSLSTTQQCLLNDNPTTAALDDDSNGDERVAYLRGSTAMEGTGSGQFRVRDDGFKLGDIVNSTPTYVGAPESLPDTLEAAPHSAFRSAYTSRTTMIYVGANDGMLHGFESETGLERIAYVPSQLYANLNKLTDPNFSNAHRYYVDGSPTVGDAYGNFASGCSSAACWRTVLVGSLGGGGKGIFALDVTDPDGSVNSALAFTENVTNAGNVVLWEHIDSTSAVPDNDMGYVYGEITIAKMKNGRWAAIFGNGYNSANENAVLYIVDIVDGTLIKKIVLNRYASATGNSNGLSAPLAFDRDSDFVVDYVYAGDLRGNLWKIDVSNTNTAQWGSAYQGATPLPLFAAVDTGSGAQIITERPTVRAHPGGQAGYMVYFGTGRYVADGDKFPQSSPINTFYGIWDENINGSATPVVRGNLLLQSITQTGAFRTVSSNTIDWSTHDGCALDLRTNQTDSLGEMSVTNPILATNAPERLIFTTLIPEQTACSFGGSGWLMEVSPTNCGNLGVSVFDTNNDGVVDASDMVGGAAVSGINPGLGIMPEVVIVYDNDNGGNQPLDLKLATGSTGAIQSIKNYLTPPSGGGPGGASPTGRRSWRQLQ